MSDEYQEPKWGEGGKVHNWRRYVSDEVQDMWRTFTPAQRSAIGRMAQEAADRENWE